MCLAVACPLAKIRCLVSSMAKRKEKLMKNNKKVEVMEVENEVDSTTTIAALLVLAEKFQFRQFSGADWWWFLEWDERRCRKLKTLLTRHLLWANAH